MNRQSLDRVVPNIAAGRLEAMFSAAGWQVITVKFGTLLEVAVRPAGRCRAARPDPGHAQPRIPAAAAVLTRGVARRGCPATGRTPPPIAALIAELDDDTLLEAIRNLGGHDLDALRDAYAQIDDTRPTVIIAYTIKGHGLPTQGHPQNHSSLLTDEQYDELAATLGMDPANPWARFDADSPGRAAVRAAARAAAPRDRRRLTPRRRCRPTSAAPRPATSTTQAALGRALLDLTREAPDVAEARRHGQPRRQLHAPTWPGG